MSHKFDKNRSVSEGYCKIPMYYTPIFHPDNKNKQLVIMDQMGKSYIAAWRNNIRDSIGPTFKIKIDTKNGGFIFKDKKYSLKQCNWVL